MFWIIIILISLKFLWHWYVDLQKRGSISKKWYRLFFAKRWSDFKNQVWRSAFKLACLSVCVCVSEWVGGWTSKHRRQRESTVQSVSGWLHVGLFKLPLLVAWATQQRSVKIRDLFQSADTLLHFFLKILNKGWFGVTEYLWPHYISVINIKEDTERLWGSLSSLSSCQHHLCDNQALAAPLLCAAMKLNPKLVNAVFIKM